MGSPPCLKKAMLTVTVILNKNGLTVQCCVCVHRPMCCAALKMTTPPPQTHTFLKWRFLADFKKYTHTPPQVTTCLHVEAKVAETTEKCQNPQSWQVLNVPERY